MNDDATMNSHAGKYAGMDRYECRRALLADLEAEGYLLKTVPHAHNVGTCYRCKTTVEPLTSNQWFVKMQPLAEPALQVVRDGRVKFEPERFTKIYTNWMENVHDWCISRQLWWGHRIPAFYCDACGEMVVSKADHVTCPKCGAAMRQEEDVLDTWFSSALWPFSTLGWPDQTADLARYYPTSVLVTGYDIIFFWVARMVFSGMEHMGKEPFSTVFIHGLVRDAQGRKMSKSLGNGIDPLEIIDRYGADALRFALASGNSPGNDMRFSDEKIEAARNFANKLWNASRFLLMNLPQGFEDGDWSLPDAAALAKEDKWVLARLNRLIRGVREAIDHYELGVALSSIYDFTWDVLCDWYIELCKSRLYEKESAGADTARRVLVHVLTATLQLLHPYMPFITEEIYCALPHRVESIMISSYPTFDPALDFTAEAEDMERVIGSIRAIRARRAEMNVPPSRRAKLYVTTPYPKIYEAAYPFFEKLASACAMELVDAYDGDDAISIVTDAATVHIPLSDMIDTEKEKARLSAEIKKTEGEITRLSAKLGNEGFLSKAPAAVVEGEKSKLEKYRATLSALQVALAKLG